MMAINLLKQMRTISQVSKIPMIRQPCGFNTLRYFSAKEKAAEPTEEELKRNREQWGLQYDDECFKFEKEWEVMAAQVEAEQSTFLDTELGDLQKAKVDLLADKILQLNVFEHRYLANVIQTKVQRATGLNPLKMNLDWPSVKQDSTGTWPPANPNWFKQQELMAQLGPFMGQMGGGGAAGAAPAAGGEAAEAEEVKEEAPQEKTHYDVELSGFDAAAKIKLIKEVRGVLKLGLKEAKETVEKSPSFICREMAKAEAEELKEKLEKVGGKVNLV